MEEVGVGVGDTAPAHANAFKTGTCPNHAASMIGERPHSSLAPSTSTPAHNTATNIRQSPCRAARSSSLHRVARPRCILAAAAAATVGGVGSNRHPPVMLLSGVVAAVGGNVNHSANDAAARAGAVWREESTSHAAPAPAANPSNCAGLAAPPLMLPAAVVVVAVALSTPVLGAGMEMVVGISLMMVVVAAATAGADTIPWVVGTLQLRHTVLRMKLV